ncbi:kinase-like domain-containing protein [Flammula alnicola]|nr:kinase-like domain-containing protein [Flammula alnicola]
MATGSDSLLGSPVLISTAMLPPEETIFFEDSSFFKHHTLSDLPTTDEIYAAVLPGYAYHVSTFPSLSLAVKRVRVSERHRASAAEGQTLWALRQFLPEVRVPEVYGWRREGVELFLFMEMIEAETLMHRWKELTEQEKTAVCAELGPMVRALRRLKRPPEEEEFIERAHKDLGLPHLPYDSPIVFTHGDLNFSNIMITQRSVKDPPVVVAIVDWEQSGWMPSFWEYSKPRFWMMWQDEGDMMKRLPEITGDVPEEVFMAFATYLQARGGLC